jgi:hypothetical protein
MEELEGQQARATTSIGEVPIVIWSIVLKTKQVRWFDQKKPEPMASPVF